jgi:hypothetical protein
MRPVDSHDSPSGVLYASVSVVPLNSFELKPKLVAQCTIRHKKFAVVTDCPSSLSFLKLYFSLYCKMYYPQDGIFFLWSVRYCMAAISNWTPLLPSPCVICLIFLLLHMPHAERQKLYNVIRTGKVQIIIFTSSIMLCRFNLNWHRHTWLINCSAIQNWRGQSKAGLQRSVRIEKIALPFVCHFHVQYFVMEPDMYESLFSILSVFCKSLKPSGYYTYHQVWHSKIPHSARTVHLCVLYGRQNKQRLSLLLFPHTALSDWIL